MSTSAAATRRYVTVDVTDPENVARIAELLDLTPIPKLDKDLKEAARRLGAGQVRFLVDAYYTQQKNRIRTAHQARKLAEMGKPNSAVDWLSAQNDTLEQRVKGMLNAYSAAHPVGEWMRRILGVGPVMAAGLLAGINIHKAPTVGHIWRICGLDPTTRKQRGQKLVWDPSLKRLCWLLGESFTKVSGRDEDIYGKVYLARKQREIERNDAGAFADQARAALAGRDFSRDTMARAWYAGCLPGGFCRQYYALPADKRGAVLNAAKGAPGSGVAMLPPARIQLRAQRYAVKLFLAHMHHVWHEVEFGRPPPKPYVLQLMGHAHYIAPPNWPMPAE